MTAQFESERVAEPADAWELSELTPVGPVIAPGLPEIPSTPCGGALWVLLTSLEPASSTMCETACTSLLSSDPISETEPFREKNLSLHPLVLFVMDSLHLQPKDDAFEHNSHMK